MEELKRKILKTLAENSTCCIATTNGKYVDNATVAYCSEGFYLFFGSFSGTVKCRNLQADPYAAVCVRNVQIHGKVRRIPYGTEEHVSYRQKYLAKFPNYDFYFKLEANELYLMEPLVVWCYDSSKGTMHRDAVVFDPDYYKALSPYETPERFAERSR